MAPAVEHDRRRPAASLSCGQSGDPAAFKVHAGDGAMLEQKAAGCHIRGAQCRHHQPRIDLMIVGAIEPRRNRRPAAPAPWHEPPAR